MSAPPSVFISRDLAPDSPFATRLRALGWQVLGESLVELQRKPFFTLPAADWLFFYSQNGVRFFFETLEMQQFFVSPTTRWAALGEGTAKVLAKYTQNIDFIGTGDPETTALAFAPKAVGQSVLFLRADHSQQSIEKHLKDQLATNSLVVYSNQMKTDFVAPQTDVLVFTSPLNVQAFVQKIADQKYTQNIVTIGKTTAQMLDSYGVTGYKIAQNPDELALAEAVLSYANKKK